MSTWYIPTSPLYTHLQYSLHTSTPHVLQCVYYIPTSTPWSDAHTHSRIASFIEKSFLIVKRKFHTKRAIRGNITYLSWVFRGVSKFKPYSWINLPYGIRETPNLSIRGSKVIYTQWILIGEFIETTSLGCLLCSILFLIRRHETNPKKKAQRKDVAFSFLPFSFFCAGTDTAWINP